MIDIATMSVRTWARNVITLSSKLRLVCKLPVSSLLSQNQVRGLHVPFLANVAYSAIFLRTVLVTIPVRMSISLGNIVHDRHRRVRMSAKVTSDVQQDISIDIVISECDSARKL